MAKSIKVKYPCRRCDLCITTQADTYYCKNPIIREQEEGVKPLCITCGCDEGYPDLFKSSDGVLHATVNCLECDMILQHKVVTEDDEEVKAKRKQDFEATHAYLDKWSDEGKGE